MKNYRVVFFIDDEEVCAYPEFADFMFPTEEEIVNKGIDYLQASLGNAKADGHYGIDKPYLNKDGQCIFNG